MKKHLYTLLLLFTLIFTPVISNAQSSHTYTFSKTTGYNWKSSGTAYCGVGEAWCGVFRSPLKNKLGYYEYNIWFQSNSYFNNCNWARTYLEGIDVYCKANNVWVVPTNYKTFSWTVGAQALYYTVYDYRPSLEFKIQVDKIEPTLY